MGKRTDDFSRLVRGDAVMVDGAEGLSLTGIVDDVAPDGSVLWIREDGGHGRRMVHETDDASVTALSQPADEAIA